MTADDRKQRLHRLDQDLFPHTDLFCNDMHK